MTGGAGAASSTAPPVRRRSSRAAEQDGGVEGHPFGADVTESPLELLFRPGVLKERAVPHLDAVPVLARETAQETGQRAEFGGAEGRRQLNPEGMSTPSEGFDRGQEGAERAAVSAVSARRRSWVIGFGSLKMNRKSGLVCPAHDFTVSRVGVA